MRIVFVASLFAGLAVPALAAPDPAKVYADNCARCHRLDGQGIVGAYPGLAGDKITNGPAPVAIRILLDGKGEMPGFRNRITDDEMAAALSFTRTRWGNAAGPVGAEEFAKLRGK